MSLFCILAIKELGGNDFKLELNSFETQGLKLESSLDSWELASARQRCGIRQ
jgi:hypothetical protein